MKRRRRRETGSEPRQQALQLIELALDDGATDEERRTAAMRAVKHIDKYDLLSRPFEGNDTAQAVMNIADTITSSGVMGDLKKIISEARRRR